MMMMTYVHFHPLSSLPSDSPLPSPPPPPLHPYLTEREKSPGVLSLSRIRKAPFIFWSFNRSSAFFLVMRPLYHLRGTHTCIHKHMHTCTYRHTHMHAHMHECTHAHTPLQMCTPAGTQPHLMHARTHAHTHARTHTFTHVYTCRNSATPHAHIHTHTCIHPLTP